MRFWNKTAHGTQETWVSEIETSVEVGKSRKGDGFWMGGWRVDARVSKNFGADVKTMRQARQAALDVVRRHMTWHHEMATANLPPKRRGY
jgi:hypothetical protein